LRFSPALWILVDVLACYRITRLITVDTVFDRPRGWVSGEGKGTGQLVGHPKLALFIRCPHCVGVWVAGAIVALTELCPREWSYVAFVLTLAAGTSLAAEWGA
jgi:hypothetical protein